MEINRGDIYLSDYGWESLELEILDTTPMRVKHKYEWEDKDDFEKRNPELIARRKYFLGIFPYKERVDMR